MEQNLERSNRTDNAMVDSLFFDEARRVSFVADYATKLFAHPEANNPQEAEQFDDLTMLCVEYRGG